MNLLVLRLALCFSAFEFVVSNIDNFIKLWNFIERHAFKLLRSRFQKISLIASIYITHRFRDFSDNN